MNSVFTRSCDCQGVHRFDFRHEALSWLNNFLRTQVLRKTVERSALAQPRKTLKPVTFCG